MGKKLISIRSLTAMPKARFEAIAMQVNCGLFHLMQLPPLSIPWTKTISVKTEWPDGNLIIEWDL